MVTMMSSSSCFRGGGATQSRRRRSAAWRATGDRLDRRSVQRPGSRLTPASAEANLAREHRSICLENGWKSDEYRSRAERDAVLVTGAG
jgi:hypothetical protein